MDPTFRSIDIGVVTIGTRVGAGLYIYMRAVVGVVAFLTTITHKKHLKPSETAARTHDQVSSRSRSDAKSSLRCCADSTGG